MGFPTRRSFAWTLVVGCVALYAPRAEAVPVGWTVVPGSSAVTLEMTITSDALTGPLTQTATTHFEGSVASSVTNPLYGQPVLELTGGDLRLADTSFAFPLGPLSFSVTLAGAGGTLTGGPVASYNSDNAYPSGGGLWQLSVEGFVIDLDQGALVVTGLPSGPFPLAATPAVFTLGAPPSWLDHVYLASESALPGVYDLGLEIHDLDATANLSVPALNGVVADVAIRMTGDLVLASTIPEPGTGLLLGGGLAGLALRRRRLSCRPPQPLPTCRRARE